jgi:3-hydroxyisobutyrate dehydrogenase
MTVAFIGLGNMGGPMSRNLARAGIDLVVYDTDVARAEPAVVAGARLASSAAAAAAGADVVITMLPTPEVIDDVLLGAGGVLAAMSAGALWVDMSTSVPEVSERVRAAGLHKQIRVLDAPVSGMSKGADAGTLQIFIGGDENDVRQALELFHILGEPDRVLHVGQLGAGYAVKLMINALWFTQLLAIAEVLTVGVKAGVDLSMLRQSLVTSPANSQLLEHDYTGILVDGDYDESFALALACKDLRLTIELAQSVGVDVPITGDVRDLFEVARGRYGDHAGEMIPVRLYEDANAVQLRIHRGEK